MNRAQILKNISDRMLFVLYEEMPPETTLTVMADVHESITDYISHALDVIQNEIPPFTGGGNGGGGSWKTYVSPIPMEERR